MVTHSEFLQLLGQSHLVQQDRLQQILQMPVNHSAALAEQLVKCGDLTQWQANQLLAGKNQFFFGKYRLLDQLGHGGMGIVFKAREERGMRRVMALKVMDQKLMEQPKSRQRFLREVKVAAMLNHPHVVAAYDADQVGESYCLIMEYVEGQDLGIWIKELGKLPTDWACECVRQAALGLQHAHEQGLVHRDIKPSNLLVVCDNPQSIPQVKILDMGVARFATGGSSGEDQDDLTGTGEVLGSFDYVSPEQAANAAAAACSA